MFGEEGGGHAAFEDAPSRKATIGERMSRIKGGTKL